ncbi:MAG: phenylacetate-CoA oxygenase subunit PaaJ [Anaerolineales bacterium]|nr:phenylacetate-CoA oxygenase subunit PaaJ [Anaerolineales bacterium]
MDAQIWQLLESVSDPEIPVISVVDMGIIQGVAVSADGTVQVSMTPTFAGCPALEMMQADIRAALEGAGYERVQIDVVLNPPWTSERISTEGRRKLKEFGLAPPPPMQGGVDGAMLLFLDAIGCPFCDSTNTRLESPFGPTLCRAIYYCNNCHQPFELFKPL